MENPRKRSNRSRNESAADRGHVVDLRSYQSKRRRMKSAKQPADARVTKNMLLKFFCYGLAGIAVVLAIFGLIPSVWQAQSLLWGIFAATIGLACGLWLYALQERFAWRVLLVLASSFAFDYLCALAKFAGA